MLQITPQQNLLIAIKPVDFRKGIDGLAAVCKQHLSRDPFSGTVFVFRNRKRNAVKVLIYDGQGFWLCNKRFSSGKLAWWPSNESPACSITVSQLQILLSQGNPTQVKIPEDWRSITTTSSVIV